MPYFARIKGIEWGVEVEAMTSAQQITQFFSLMQK
jgi:hypothetical protein